MPRVLLGAVLLVSTAVGCVSQKNQALGSSRADLGHAYIAEGNIEQAIETLRSAVDADPRSVDAWHNLALAYVARGANDEADKAFRRALRLDSESAPVNLNYAYLLQKQGRVSEAIERLEVARADLTYRQPAKVLNNLGYAYLVNGQGDAAVRSLEEAVARQPNFCAAWYNLGLAYEETDHTSSSLEAMDRVVMICPKEYPEATLKAGELLVADGRLHEGKAYLERVIAEHPGTPLSKRAVAVIQEGALQP